MFGFRLLCVGALRSRDGPPADEGTDAVGFFGWARLLMTRRAFGGSGVQSDMVVSEVIAKLHHFFTTKHVLTQVHKNISLEKFLI